MANSLIAVVVPEVESRIATLRERYDRSARRGLGAHITLRHAALAAGGLGARSLAAIAGVAATTAPFEYAITGVARFPGTLYLTVEPPAPFADFERRLAQALDGEAASANAGRPFVPHISVARRSGGVDVEGEEVREVEQRLAAQFERDGLIRAYCREIVLLEDTSGAWRPVRSFAVGD